eukprot:SAG31_NODE_5517_length_2482_cov_3.611414_2_plen_106_part_00
MHDEKSQRLFYFADIEVFSMRTYVWTGLPQRLRDPGRPGTRRRAVVCRQLRRRPHPADGGRIANLPVAGPVAHQWGRALTLGGPLPRYTRCNRQRIDTEFQNQSK